MNSRLLPHLLAAVLGAAALQGTAQAQNTEPAAAPPAAAPPAAPAASAPSASTVEPRATQALERMGNYLVTLHSFAVKARSTTDVVLEGGEKVQFEANVSMWATRPNRLRLDFVSDKRDRQLFYDGKTVTIFGKSSGYYARVPAPSTIREVADKLRDAYGVELPLMDLFAWGDPAADHPQLTTALAIGPATIRGIACDQYVFRQDGADWQLWIQRGNQPLPRRLVITSTTDDARPQYTVDYDWTPAASIGADTFAFKPPAGAHEIPMRRLDEIAQAPR